MRPALKAGLRPLWRDRDTLQIGVDPRRAAALTGLGKAAAGWAGLTDARGVDGRDALWAHPDLLPTAEDLEDPDAFVRGQDQLDISDLTGDQGGPDSGGPDSSDAEDDQGGPGGG